MFLIEIVSFETIKDLRGVEECGTTTRNDSFLLGSSSSTESILNSVLQLRDLNLR